MSNKISTFRLGHRAEVHGATGTLVCGLVILLAVFFTALTALGQEPAHPLKPPDRSSPAAALKTFLDSGDAVGSFLAQNYLPSPSRAEFHQLLTLADQLLQCLDLSLEPPAFRVKVGRAAALALYETLNRIKLPPFNEIPGIDQLGSVAGSDSKRWVFPETEIALVRTQSGPHSGEFLFSADTVAKAGDFYGKIRGLPYSRPVPLENVRDVLALGGGWMVHYSWVKALPAWLQTPIADQASWKWIALVLLLSFFALFLRSTYRLSHRGSIQHPFLQALTQVALPAFFLLAAPALAYLSLLQLNLRGGPAVAIEFTATTIMYIAGAWISWRFAAVIAEAIIASPRIAPESVDAHLHPHLFPLAGGPLRGGSEEGTIEAIGIRSTRIRGKDRTLTTIPNAALSKMSIVNLTQRDRMLIQSVIGIRCETSPEQLRYLLVNIREMLLSHPCIHPDLVHARFTGFGASSLDIEVFAYVTTSDRAEFFSIREDILLRIMEIVEQSGTGFAFPSQTLYFTRDDGLDADKTEVAET